LTGTLVNSANSEQITAYSPKEVFFCPEESHFYSQCLEKMVFNRCTDSERVIEFGSGDGSPVIHGLLRTQFRGIVHGYELNPKACQVARSRIQQYQLTSQYVIHNGCFFEGWQRSPADYLISNPPYLPAPDNQLYMPALHGGSDGAELTRKLFSVGCECVLSLISAYSNPVETIQYALAQGYRVTDFMISPLQFGYYSSEAKVKNTITALHHQGKAFYSQKIYLLAGVMFERSSSEADLSTELIQVMTALQ
jgi:hypothetical protein